MTTTKINTAGDVYQFVEHLKAASQKNGATELYRRLDNAMRLGSSGLEVMGAIRETVSANRDEIERLLGPDGTQHVDQVVAFVDRAFGR
jgi:hypothetical protein